LRREWPEHWDFEAAGEEPEAGAAMGEGATLEEVDATLVEDVDTTLDEGAGTSLDMDTIPDEDADTTPDEDADTTPDEGADTTPDEGADTTPDEGADTTPDEGADTSLAEGVGTKVAVPGMVGLGVIGSAGAEGTVTGTEIGTEGLLLAGTDLLLAGACVEPGAGCWTGAPEFP